MIVQHNELAYPGFQYLFASLVPITLYVEIYGLAPCHTLIRETI